MSEVLIRIARLSDIPAIVDLDRSRYGEITGAQTDDPASMFERRLKNSPNWFFVAEIDGAIEGILSCQPTSHRPDDFVSWEQCTADGTFEGTLDEKSPFVYVAALTVSPTGSSNNATDALLVAATKLAIQKKKKQGFFSARMPRYWRYANKMAAEDYVNQRVHKQGRDTALDPQIRFYEELGMKRHRLVKDGFKADWQSGGYAVLFTMDIPFYRWPFSHVWAWLFSKVAERPRLFAFFVRHF